MSVNTKIDRLIDYVGQTEARGRYDTWNPNDAGYGVSYGLIQFNQKLGSLPALLQRMHAKSPSEFQAVFGPNYALLLDAARVKTLDLNTESWKPRFMQAARVEAFRAAQREIAREQYFNPAMDIAKQHGLKSERAHAMLFDTAVQRGAGKAASLMAAAASQGGTEKEILARFAPQADNITNGVTTRRQDIFADVNISDAALLATGISLTVVVAAGLIYFWLKHRK